MRIKDVIILKDAVTDLDDGKIFYDHKASAMTGGGAYGVFVEGRFPL